MLMQKLAPFRQVIIAYILFPFLLGHNRKDKMQIRMRQRIILQTRRAMPATIRLSPMGTIQITRISKRQGKSTCPPLLRKELRMGNYPRLSRLNQVSFNLFLSYNIFEIHLFYFLCKCTKLLFSFLFCSISSLFRK